MYKRPIDCFVPLLSLSSSSSLSLAARLVSPCWPEFVSASFPPSSFPILLASPPQLRRAEAPACEKLQWDEGEFRKLLFLEKENN
jgi:hypothetical protein